MSTGTDVDLQLFQDWSSFRDGLLDPRRQLQVTLLNVMRKNTEEALESLNTTHPMENAPIPELDYFICKQLPQVSMELTELIVRQLEEFGPHPYNEVMSNDAMSYRYKHDRLSKSFFSDIEFVQIMVGLYMHNTDQYMEGIYAQFIQKQIDLNLVSLTGGVTTLERFHQSWIVTNDDLKSAKQAGLIQLIETQIQDLDAMYKFSSHDMTDEEWQLMVGFTIGSQEFVTGTSQDKPWSRLSPWAQIAFETIDNLIDRSPVTTVPHTLWRGIRLRSPDDFRGDRGSYLSTSLTYNDAAKYAKAKCCMLMIKVEPLQF